VVDSISHNWRVNPMGSKGAEESIGFTGGRSVMMLPEYRTGAHPFFYGIERI
jgi:hypothetical protein